MSVAGKYKPEHVEMAEITSQLGDPAFWAVDDQKQALRDAGWQEDDQGWIPPAFPESRCPLWLAWKCHEETRTQ